jgi:hypothetical protein
MEMLVFIPEHSISIKFGLCNGTFKFNHNHFATGVVGGGDKTFHNSQPMDTFLNERVADCLYPGQRGLLYADHFFSRRRARIGFPAVDARRPHHATSVSWSGLGLCLCM